MKKFILAGAVFCALFLGRPAVAGTMVNFTYLGFVPFQFTFATGTLTLGAEAGNEFPVMSATGEIDGSQITGVSGVVGFRDFLDFTTSTGSANFAWNGTQETLSVFNSAGTLTNSVIVGGFEFDPPLSATPLPGSAPMFGLALLVLAAFGFASKRLKREAGGPDNRLLALSGRA